MPLFGNLYASLLWHVLATCSDIKDYIYWLTEKVFAFFMQGRLQSFFLGQYCQVSVFKLYPRSFWRVYGNTKARRERGKEGENSSGPMAIKGQKGPSKTLLGGGQHHYLRG